MPTGVTVASGSKSWSAALVERRLLPPRAKGPTLTVAFASIEIRTVCSSASASSLICFTWAKIASVSGSFFWVDSWPPFLDTIPARSAWWRSSPQWAMRHHDSHSARSTGGALLLPSGACRDDSCETAGLLDSAHPRWR